MKPPLIKKILKCKRVHKKKKGILAVEDERYKVWLVAKGYSQAKSVDFTYVFLPVANRNSICILLTLVVMYDFELEQFDVKTAFLHGEHEE